MDGMFTRNHASFFLVAATFASPVFPATTPGSGASCSVKDFGAVGDGKTKDTAAIQKAVDAAHDAGGGSVVFPPGTYLTGTIYLKSRVRLHIGQAVTLLGSPDSADYPANRCAFRSYSDKYVQQALIWGENLHDIAITGRGAIDGQGAAFKGLPWRERPYVIRLISCRNILVEDVTLRNSAMWMQHYLNCDFVTIRAVQVYNHCAANNDMIDIDCCRDVVITDCFADSDDDALTLKSTADRPSENITIANCVLSSHCNAIKMGTESNGGFKNVTITNCTIRPSRHPTHRAGRAEGLAGIALEVVDGGSLDRVTISNITVLGQTAPLFIRLGNRARPFKKDMPKPGVGTLRNVVISNIVATDATRIGCSITGQPGHPVQNVTLSNIKLRFAGGGTAADALRAIPELPRKYPECTMFGVLPAYGLYCRHVDGLTLRDVDVRCDKPDGRPALVCDDVQNLQLDHFNAQGGSGASATLLLQNVRTAMIRGCVAPPDVAAFLSLHGQCDRISVIGNDLSAATRPFAFAEATPPSVLYEQANRTKK